MTDRANIIVAACLMGCVLICAALFYYVLTYPEQIADAPNGYGRRASEIKL